MKPCLVHGDRPAAIVKPRLDTTRPLYIPLCDACIERWRSHGVEVETPAAAPEFVGALSGAASAAAAGETRPVVGER